MDDLTKEFLQESSENLDRLDQDFVKLESDPGNPELVKSIFRTIHTIKGTCGFLGFTQLESVAHAAENLLSWLPDGEIALTPEITTALLQMVDAIRQMLQSIDVSGSEGERNDEELVQTLTRLQHGAAKPAAESHEAAGVPAAAPEEQPPVPSEGKVTQAGVERRRGLDEGSCGSGRCGGPYDVGRVHAVHVDLHLQSERGPFRDFSVAGGDILPAGGGGLWLDAWKTRGRNRRAGDSRGCAVGVVRGSAERYVWARGAAAGQALRQLSELVGISRTR